MSGHVIAEVEGSQKLKAGIIFLCAHPLPEVRRPRCG